jgi:hypothetical protein
MVLLPAFPFVGLTLHQADAFSPSSVVVQEFPDSKVMLCVKAASVKLRPCVKAVSLSADGVR